MILYLTKISSILKVNMFLITYACQRKHSKRKKIYVRERKRARQRARRAKGKGEKPTP